MCTAISDVSLGRHLFGRTLDLECSYGEQITIAPSQFIFNFKYEKKIDTHSTIIGTAHVSYGHPLFYDAINGDGLAVAALNFPHFAHYSESVGKRSHAVASYELLPWVLCKCKSVDEAKKLLSDTDVTADSFSDELPPTPLHWLIADKSGAIVAEPLQDGLHIIDDPLGVLTNSPPFEHQLLRLQEIIGISPHTPRNTLCPELEIKPYTRGLGGIGLPGDLSSTSRFCRAIFAKKSTLPELDKTAAVSRFFHIMDMVSQPNGCVVTAEGQAVRTVYTSCADTSDGSYYFTTYGNRRIRRANISQAPSDTELFTIEMRDSEDIENL